MLKKILIYSSVFILLFCPANVQSDLANNALVQKTSPAGRWCNGSHIFSIQTNIKVDSYISFTVDYTDIEWTTPGEGEYAAEFTRVHLKSNALVTVTFSEAEHLVPDVIRNMIEMRDVIGNPEVEVEYTWNGVTYGPAGLNASFTYFPAGVEHTVTLSQRITVEQEDSQNIWFHDPGGFTMTVTPTM
ncbi:MAG: hypothetical protein QME81_02740 [bacterium]|nr:hypothetical protein [bacterium]